MQSHWQQHLLSRFHRIRGKASSSKYWMDTCQLLLPGMAVEKLTRDKFAEISSRQDAL
jgi:hypothetical protein